MLTRTRRPRAGFTLIELLVVMGIIATLIALLLPALGGARASAVRTQNTDRMGKIATALTNLKEPQAGLNLDSVPAHPINTTLAPGAAGAPVGFALKRIYRGDEPEVFYLKKAWPNMNTTLTPDRTVNPPDETNGFAGPDVVLDANQTLVFFLTGGGATNGSGFSHNPRRPFAPPTPGEKRKGPFLEFNTSYIVAAPTNGHPWVIDPYGTPYAYFAAVNGKPGAYFNPLPAPVLPQSYTPATTPPVGTAGPVLSGGKYVKENSFQIISAGRDKLFGGGGPLPLTGSPGGADDQGHFQPTVLGAN